MMPGEEEKVYMLLELERIKELRIPHLYVFPTAALEFTCAVFKGPRYTAFKLVKRKIHEKWMVLLDEEHSKEAKEIASTHDAHTTLYRVMQALSNYLDSKTLKKPKDIFPFIFKDPANGKRDISELLLFIESRCFKKNSNGQKAIAHSNRGAQ
ncbi:hypothetical protein PFJ87_06g01440 [Encephalitozoon hellem]|uniref:Uncharacterized protein n=2 Tax=Encephalitozoon hellem TaxID=27973 RepID=A0A9Q9CA83_ENCHE|nr:hypothetical protein GPU96_06g11610 [Encephalitozoon hellem]WEL38876.1 hypothetical protein PFJ87_06g01440 [Encephalitozoon hellem]